MPNLWAYFALGQAVPASFAANLFLVAMLLSPVPAPPAPGAPQPAAPAPEPARDARGAVRRPAAKAGADANADGARTMLAVVFHYVVLLTMLPSKRRSAYFTAFAAGLRALLAAPLLVSGPKSCASPHREYGAVWLTMGAAAAALLAVQGALLAREGRGVAEVLVALDESPPVGALGYDVLLGAVSVVVWLVGGRGGKADAEKEKEDDEGRAGQAKRRRVKSR